MKTPLLTGKVFLQTGNQAGSRIGNQADGPKPVETFSRNIMSLFLLQAWDGGGYFCKMRVLLLFCFIFITFSLNQVLGAADSSDSSSWNDWKDVKTLADTNHLEEALKELISHPQESAPFYYNLGTLYLRSENMALAVAYLEKANRIHPRNPDIQFNLSLARHSLEQLIGEERLDSSSSWIEKLADTYSFSEIRTLLGFLAVCIVLAWTLTYMRTHQLRKTFLNIPVYFGMIGLGLSLGMYTLKKLAEATPPAIAIENQTLRSGPGLHFQELSQLDKGSKVRLLDSSNSEDWIQVRYSYNAIGWIKASGVLKI